jgi:hypothetical protein
LILPGLLSFYERKVWIGSDGLILREESATSDVYPANVTTVETVSYEYHPKDVAPLEVPIK